MIIIRQAISKLEVLINNFLENAIEVGLISKVLASCDKECIILQSSSSQ